MLSRRLGLFVSILSCTLAYYTQPIEVAQISPSLMAVVPGVFTINYNINSTATVSFTVPFSSSPQMLVNLQNMMYKPDTYWVSIDILQVRPASATLSFINSGSGFISFQVKFNVFASLSP